MRLAHHQRFVDELPQQVEHLGRRERRFLTVACVGVDEAPIPILSHVGSALESGDITRPEMDELIRTFRAYDNDERADVLQAAAESPWPPVIPAR